MNTKGIAGRLRFTLGRAVIHAGLRIMPRSRARSELYTLFELWGTGVSKAVRQHLEVKP
jgi:hypothetical protein